jgi:pantoate--beta-alanine ligase
MPKNATMEASFFFIFLADVFIWVSRMQIVSHTEELTELLDQAKREGRRIGVVPTMGALHDGHLSLVDLAAGLADLIVVTIFVNPTQFAPTEDLATYPRTFAEDCEALRSRGVDIVFCPADSEMYPAGFSTFIEPPEVARGWEGRSRPTHFRGVATVVLKLLNVTRADVGVFGQKDYQQVAVIRRMVADLNHPCIIAVAPIVRDKDGVALSSRNRHLSPGERTKAAGIRRALLKARQAIWETPLLLGSDATQIMRDELLANEITEIDYAVAVDPDSLEPQHEVELPVVLLIAARVGTTRLIDNEWIKAGS